MKKATTLSESPKGGKTTSEQVLGLEETNKFKRVQLRHQNSDDSLKML